MGEHKANKFETRRLLLRLRFPTHEPMVVQVDLTADYLERTRKLMLICEKIRQTMRGREAPIQRLLAIGRVKEWCQLQSIWIPEGFLLGELGHCRVMAGMRRNQTIVEKDGVWIRGHDGAHELVSVALGRDRVNRELAKC